MKHLKIFFAAMLFIPLQLLAQKKVKGNKTITTQKRELSKFTTLEINDHQIITLEQSSIPYVNITTDENLHEFIKTDIQNEVLSIENNGEIRWSKDLEITIGCSIALNQINIRDKAIVNATELMEFNNLHIKTLGNSKLELKKIQCDSLYVTTNEKSKLTLESQVDFGQYQIYDHSEIKGSMESKEFQIITKDHGNCEINGRVKHLNIEGNSKENLILHKLKSNTASVNIKNNANYYLNISDSIQINAKEKATTYLIGENPHIDIKNLSDQTAIIRKLEDFKP